MKKNKMMRLASVLLIAVMVSTSAISGTYAKYVTSGESSDSARVAKFGVKVEANFSELFAQGYKADDKTAATEDEATVWTRVAADNLVAPGTAGTLADFTVTGKPEVDVEVTYVATLTLTNWFVDTNKNGVKDTGEEEYCPIVFTVNGKDYSMDDGYADVAAFAAAVKAAIEDSDEIYQTNTDLSEPTAVAKDLDVSWKWHFEGKTEHTLGTGPKMQYDAKDTALGNQAVQDGDWASCKAATIALEISCTVTQIN